MAGLERDVAITGALADPTVAPVVLHEKSEKRSSSEASISDVEHELDGIHDGLEFPTEEEKLTLRRVSDAIPWNAYMIAMVELAERFSFYGSTVVFTNFIQFPIPDGSRTGAGGPLGHSGALGLKQQASTGLTTFFQLFVQGLG